LVERSTSKGEKKMKIEGVEGAVLDESFKKVANYLLHSDVRKHN
jgi:hypothetical protein